MVNGRKYAKRAKKAVKRRYFRKGKYSKPNVYAMAKDISLLRGMLNSEKKILQVSTPAGVSYPLGQVQQNASGHYIQDFTPLPVQGVENNQRVGSQIKLTSFHMDLQLLSQNSAISGNRFILELWNVRGQALSNLSDFMSDVYKPNTFTTGSTEIFDTTSNRNIDNFKSYTCIHRQKLYLAPEDQAGQVSMRTFQVGKKFGKNGHMIRYASPDFPDVQSGQIVLVIRADQGNSSATASTVGGILTQSPYTGAWYKANITYYYIDN